ncbi:MAG: tRNA glutamyl-Q(34) synthetase GluQRS [Rhodovibrionaceae bacterium]|nr:tRNA glutamyl-Q(34) synthetase GluQRS [Rhodovibrionaceae bacterium]
MIDALSAGRQEVTRFAPSPTGLLHLGHGYSALFAWAAAMQGGGRFLLRIEDIDIGRCRPEYEAAILEDLSWLGGDIGLAWEEPVRRQSQHMADYQDALDRLARQGLLYPCFCTRREIIAEIEAAGGAPHGPDGPLYPGTCRSLSADERAARTAAGEQHALRLDMDRARAVAGALTWVEEGIDAGEVTATPEVLGDAVLARKDVATSYHLAVTVDDALQGVTLVTRGEDLKHATHLHRLLQALLDLPVPRWRHHRLLTAETGQRLAKRHESLTLAALREAGHSPAEVRKMAEFEG